MAWVLELELELEWELEVGEQGNAQHEDLIVWERSIKFAPGRIRMAPELDTILNARLILVVKV